MRAAVGLRGGQQHRSECERPRHTCLLKELTPLQGEHLLCSHKKETYYERVEIFIQAIVARAKIDVSSMLCFTSDQMLLMLEALALTTVVSCLCRCPDASTIAFANASIPAKRYPYASSKKSRSSCHSFARSSSLPLRCDCVDAHTTPSPVAPIALMLSKVFSTHCWYTLTPR